MATAFAIFCANDGSLTFYKRETVPAVGSEFEGKIVGAVYTGFETSSYTSTTIPWRDNVANIVSVSFVDEITPISTQRWFNGAINMISFNGANLNTSNVTTMSYMFRNCPSLTSSDLSSFNTSNVTTMSYMFCDCTNLSTIYVSDLWTTAAVTSSDYMFGSCKLLVGDIHYDSNYRDATYATYTGGYLTYKFYADYFKDRFVIDGKELSDIGNKIRTLTGVKEGMTPAQMAEALGNYIDSLSSST